MKKWVWLGLLFWYTTYADAQGSGYQYARPLEGVAETWHKIQVPNEVFGQTQSDIAAIRVVGIEESGDTLEVPYVRQALLGKQAKKKVDLKVINQVEQNGKHYFTLGVPTQEIVNQLTLNFAQKNFDWRISLEGSQDQKTWDKVVKDYRILSIQNQLTHYQFTTLQFPNAKYRYFRVGVNSKEQPKVESVSLFLEESMAPTYQTYPIQKMAVEEDRQNKKTIVQVDLGQRLPISYLQLFIQDTLDYVRRVESYAILDSTETKQGWHYHKGPRNTAVLHSATHQPILWDWIVAQRLEFIIDNQDNQPLTIDSIVVKCYIQELTARFPKQEENDYYLIYGNKKVNRPNYDLASFQHKIPKMVTQLKVGEERLWSTGAELTEKTAPLILNKAWLWMIMGMIILMLGGFSLKMIRN